MSDFVVEGRWTTKAGLEATVAVVHGAHRCGYVRVPAESPLFGIGYAEECKRLRRAYIAALRGPLGKRSVMTLLGGCKNPTPEVVFDVHGSLTFSGDLLEPGTWWFGFDAAHAGDGRMGSAEFPSLGPVREFDYMANECESLARQIVDATTPKKRGRRGTPKD